MPDHSQIIDRIRAGHHAHHDRRDLHSPVRRAAIRASGEMNPPRSSPVQPSTLGQPQHRHQTNTRHQVRFLEHR
jgi:hypothetical protein